MSAILNSLNAHNLLIFQQILMILVSKFMVYRALSDKTQLSLGLLSPLIQVKSIAECSKVSILQYFRPSLSYHFPLSPLICLFLSGRLRQVLLYFDVLCHFVFQLLILYHQVRSSLQILCR